MFRFDYHRMVRPESFDTHYQCYSMAMVDKSHLDDGDKILLPQSALTVLSQMEVEYPMLFELKNERLGRRTHCGVSEFTADEGKCHLPFFMMQNLLIEEGSLISIKNVSLQKASFIKVRAQSVDFLEISNPRAALEVNLRKYTCVTVGDQIVLQHLGRLHYLDVQEVRPNGAASIVETDVEIDFDEPLGFKDSKYAIKEDSLKAAGGGGGSTAGTVIKTVQRARAGSDLETEGGKSFKAFGGSGNRIDGKQTSSSSSSSSSSADAKAGPSGPGGGAMESKVTTSGSSDSKAGPPAPAPAPAPAPTYQSRIGDKFSKKKAAATAFSGTGHKLT